MNQSYHFTHTILPLEVIIQDGSLLYKANIKQKQISLSSLQYFYLSEPADSAQYELVLATALPNQKLNRLRIYSNLGEKDFLVLIDFLKQSYPQCDLCHLDATTAYQKMGSQELSTPVILSLIWLSTVIVSLLLLPLLLHGLEGENPQKIALNELKQAKQSYVSLFPIKPALEFQALVEQSKAIVGNQSSAYEKTSPKSTILFPLVEPNWQADQPIELIGKWTGSIDQLSQQKEWAGTLRNRLWEGVGENERTLLLRQNLRISPQVTLIEINQTPKNDLYAFLMILGFYTALALAVSLFLHLKYQSKQSPKIPLNPHRKLEIDEDQE